MNNDNIISKVYRIALETKKSPRTNTEYTQLIFYFINDYQFRVFINNEQKFAIKDALNTLNPDSPLDIDNNSDLVE